MRLAIFPAHVSEVLRLARKSEARSYEVLHLSNKAILPNLQIWCSKMQPLSGNQRPDLLTALMNMSLALRPPRKMHLCRSCFWKCYKTVTFCWLLTRSTIPCACHAKRHLNLQKWREHVVFCTFCLWNVLRATTACTFSASQLAKSAPNVRCFSFFTCKCASTPQRRALFRHHWNFQHSGSRQCLRFSYIFIFEMCFAPQRRAILLVSLIGPYGSAPRRLLASSTFRPSGATNHVGKTQCFATCLNFSRTFDLLSSDSSIFSGMLLI